MLMIVWVFAQFSATATTPLPDLTPHSVGPVSISGNTATFTTTITNRGTGAAAGTFYHQVFFSKNQSFEATDVNLVQRLHSTGIAQGASVTFTNSATLPVAAASGGFFIVIEDSDGNLLESNELNNTNAFEIAVTAAGADSFANRTALVGGRVTALGTNTTASKESGEPIHEETGANSGGKSLWWTWTAPNSGRVTIHTSGSTNASGDSLDTVLAVYTNNVLTELKRVAADDNVENPAQLDDYTSWLQFDAIQGVAYQIAVDGWKDELTGVVDSGSIQLTINQDALPTVTPTRPPAHSVFSALSPIELCARATDPGGSIRKLEILNGDSVIGTVSPPSGSQETIDLCWTWTNAPVGSHSISFRVTDLQGNAALSTPIPIRVELSNDFFAQRTAISGNVMTLRGNNSHATHEAFERENELHRHPHNEGGKSVWYRWVCPSNGLARVILDFDGVPWPWPSLVTVFLGDQPNGLTRVAFNDQNAGRNVAEFINETPGTVYSIAVDGVRQENGEVFEGEFTLDVRVSRPPLIQWRSPTVSLDYHAGTNIAFSASASDTDGRVEKVEFLLNDRVIGEGTGRFWNFATNFLPEGQFPVFARATDNLGFTAVTTNWIYVNVWHDPGIKLWQFTTTGKSLSITPAIDEDGVLYFGSDEGLLYAVQRDGTPKWPQPFKIVNPSSGFLAIRCAPAIGRDGTIYFGSDDGGVYAVNPDGSLKWKFAAKHFVSASPVIAADGTIYAVDQSGGFYVLDPKDGKEIWSIQTGAQLSYSPSIGPNGYVYFGSWNSNQVYAYRPEHRQVLTADLAANERAFYAPAIGRDGTVYLGTSLERVLSFSPTLEILKTNQSTVSGPSMAIGGDDALYFASGGLRILNSDLTLRTNISIPGFSRTAPALAADGTVYLAIHDSVDSKLLALHQEDPSKTWSVSLGISGGEDLNSPVIGLDGTVYVANGGSLFAFKGSQGLAASPWPQFRRNRAQTGSAEPQVGDVLWEMPTGGPMTISPAIAPDGTIYYTGNGRLFASDRDGSNTREIARGLRYDPAPVVAPDGSLYLVFFPGSDNRIGILRPGATNTTEPFPTGAWITSTPALDGSGTLYFGGEHVADGQAAIYAFASDGTPKPGWPFRPGGRGGIVSSPVLGADGSVYFGAPNGTNYALNPNGTKKWTFATGEAVDSSPAIGADGTVYFSTHARGGELVASDPATGAARWRLQGPGGSSSPIIGPDGMIYVGSIYQGVFSITPQGTTNWQNYLDGKLVASTPVLGHDGMLYVGAEDGKIYALNSRGEVSWAKRVAIESIRHSSPTLGLDGTLYIGVSDGFNNLQSRLVALRTSSRLADAPWPKFHRNLRNSGDASLLPGDKLWQFDTGYSIADTAAVSGDGTIYVVSGVTLYSLQPSGKTNWTFEIAHVAQRGGGPAIAPDNQSIVVSCLDWGSDPLSTLLYSVSASGSKRWERRLAGVSRNVAPTIASDGTVYFGTEAGILYALSRDTGETLWSKQVGTFGNVAPVIDSGGSIYLGVDTNQVIALNPDRSERWRSRVGSELSGFSPALGGNGLIYFADYGAVYAFQVADGTPVWTNDVNYLIYGSPIVGPDETVYVAVNFDTFLLQAIDGRTGKDRWSFPLPGGYSYGTPVLGADKSLYIGSSDLLHAVRDLGARAEQLWEFKGLGNMGYPPLLTRQGELYIGSTDGSLYALKASSGLASGRWPTYRGGNQRTGLEGSIVNPGQGPANDPFAAAENLEGKTIVTSGSNVRATRELGEPSHAGLPGGKSVWFAWRAPSSGSATVSLAGTKFDTLLGVYTGPTLASLFEVASDDDSGGNGASRTTFVAVGGTLYHIAVDGFGGASGAISLRLDLNAPPLVSFVEPLDGAAFLAPATIALTAAASDPEGEPVTVEFRTESLLISRHPAVPFQANWSQPVPGTYTLWARALDAAGLATTSAPVVIRVNQPAPANDHFASAQRLQGANSSAAGSNQGGSIEPNEPPHPGRAGGRSVWWTWTALHSGKAIVSTLGSSFDTLLAVYSGAAVGALRLEGADDDSGGNSTSEVQFEISEGFVYHFRVDGFSGSAGEIALAVREIVPPTVFITSPNSTAAEFSAPATIAFTTKVSDLDGRVVRVTFTANGLPIGDGADAGGGSFGLRWENVPAGSYRIIAAAVDDAGNQNDSAALNLKVGGLATPPRILTQPLPLILAPGGSGQLAVAADGTPPLAYQWFKNGSRVTDGTNAFYRISTAEITDAASYSVLIANSAGSITSTVATVQVAAPPIILVQPENRFAAAGESAVFSIIAESQLPIRYRWRFNSEPISAATNSTYRIATASTTAIGIYSVMVENDAGSILSTSASLTVEGADRDRPPLAQRDEFWIPNGPVHTMAETNGILYLGGEFQSIGPNIGRAAVFDSNQGLVIPGFPRVNGSVAAIASDGVGGWFLGGTFTAVGGVSRTNLAHLRADGTLNPGWNPDANRPVRALALHDGVLYAGGQFSLISGQSRANFAALDAASGVAFEWSAQTDGPVFALLADAGGLYVGGQFSQVGGITRKRIAQVTRDGQVTAWNPNANGAVYALARNGDVLYAGGGFSHIGGLARNRIAALNAASGDALVAWDANAGTRSVWALAAANNLLYAGGEFIEIGGQPRRYAAALDATGRATNWRLDLDNALFALSVVSNRVYLGGQFTQANGVQRSRLAAADALTGALLPWNPRVDSKVYALASANNYVIAGGDFASAGVLPRENLAAIDIATGRPLDWTANCNGPVEAIALIQDVLVAGGRFSLAANTPRLHLAAFSRSSGELLGWKPDPDQPVLAIAVTSGTIWLGGEFEQISGQPRARLAAIDPRGTLIGPLNPGADGTVHDLEAADGILYVAGNFTTLGGSERKNLGAIDAATGALTPWKPIADLAVLTLELAPGGTGIFAGGAFREIGGETRHRLALIDLKTGAALGWSPTPTNTFRTGIEAIAAHANRVFVGGDFNKIGGSPRSNLALLDAVSGQPDIWNPGTDGQVRSLLAPSPSTVFVGGNFLQVGGEFRPYLAAFTPRGLPIILQQPRPIVAATGSNAVLRATIRGLEPMTFQWRFGGVPIPGATSATLELRSLSPQLQGVYDLVASNAVGLVTSEPVRLTVLAPPVITTQPQNRQAAPGTDVTFSVIATGSQPLRYQWLRNGIQLPAETNSALRLPSVQASQSGRYRVFIENAVGLVQSDSAVLTVDTAAIALADHFANRSTNATASGSVAGSNLGATREVREPFHAGKPASRSVWLAWRAPFTGMATFDTIGSTFDTLLAVYSGASVTTLTEVTSDEDQGGFFASRLRFNAVQGSEYQIAIDGFGGATGLVILNWRLDPDTDELPRIVRITPGSQAVPAAGSKVTQTVELANPGSFTFQWFLNGQPIPDATSSTLIIGSFQLADVGAYRVEVGNGRRSVSSAPVTIELGPIANAFSHDKFKDLVPDEIAAAAAMDSSRGAKNFASVSAGIPGVHVLDNFGASNEQEEPLHAGVVGGSSRWFRIRVAAAGTLQLDTIGSEIDTLMGVYAGTDLLSLRQIASDDNSAPDGVRSLLLLEAAKNDEYLVAVDGVGGATGNIRLNWRLGAPPTIAASPSTAAAAAGAPVALSATLTGSPVPALQWILDGVDIPGATNSTLTIPALSMADAGRYRLRASNFAGTIESVEIPVSVSAPATLRLSGIVIQLDGTVQLRIDGVGAQPIVIEASTNLLDWLALFTNSAQNAGSSFDFIDTPASQRPMRFYRAKEK